VGDVRQTAQLLASGGFIEEVDAEMSNRSVVGSAAAREPHDAPASDRFEMIDEIPPDDSSRPDN
jgi:hypothetical protein